MSILHESGSMRYKGPRRPGKLETGGTWLFSRWFLTWWRGCQFNCHCDADVLIIMNQVHRYCDIAIQHMFDPRVGSAHCESPHHQPIFSCTPLYFPLMLSGVQVNAVPGIRCRKVWHSTLQPRCRSSILTLLSFFRDCFAWGWLRLCPGLEV